MFPPDPSAPNQLDEKIKQVVTEIFKDPLNPILETFVASIPGYLEVNPPTLPITQITGFTKFTATTNSLSASFTTTSTSYTSVGGPTLSSLPDGAYVLFYGAQASISNALYVGLMAPSVNSGTVSDYQAAATNFSANEGSVTAASLASLSAGTNSVDMQYRSTNVAGTARFLGRWLIALKYANN